MPTYEELTKVERRVWDAFLLGGVVDLRGADEECTVRAEVITALVLSRPSPQGAVPALRLTGARITGRLDLGGATIEHQIRLENCHFEQQVVLRGASLRSTSLLGCHLPGLQGWLLRVDGKLSFENSVIDGRLTLTGAHVTGELRLSGVHLTATELSAGSQPDPASAPGIWALWAGGLVVDGGCFARHGFTARGGLRLVGARFNGGLFMEKARIDNPGGDALTGDDLTASTMILSDGFTAVGAIRLPGATVPSRLSLDTAVLQGGELALGASRLQAGDLQLTLATTPVGTIDLQEAQVAVLHDNEHSWPADTRLDGFRYNTIQVPAGSTEPVAARLHWLDRLPGYAPQPYEQLAAWYRKIGHDDDARRVLLEKQRRRRRTLSPIGRAWGRLLDVTVGYGYRPWQAALWLLGLTLLGTTAFSQGQAHAASADQGSPFNPFIYTLDLLLPIVGFGQRTAWYWTGLHQWLAYGLIAAGWLLTTTVVAGVSRSLSRT